MMFVGSSGAFEEAMNTGSGISRLDFIQSYDFSFDIERTPLKQIGSDSFATRQTQLAPDVNLNIQYYLNDGWNEKYIGLDVVTGQSVNPFDSILSSTGDRNFYISIAQNDGVDQNLQTEIVNSNILAIGNCYITSYEISIAVNQLATVSCSFVGSNANVQDYATSKYLPSVNTIASGQNAEDVNKNFSLNFVNNSRTERYLPKAKEVFDGGCPYNSCKITPDFQSGGGTSPITFGFFDAIANNFQSMQFSVQFERKSLYGFGNNHPYGRKIQAPIIGNLSLSSMIDDFQAENLSKVFHNEGGIKKSVLVEFFNADGIKKIGLSFQNLTLQSYNLGARIGDRIVVETQWTVEIKKGGDSDVKMIASYGIPVMDQTLVNESFTIERLFYYAGFGNNFSGALDQRGTLWTWGADLFGAAATTEQPRATIIQRAQTKDKTFCKIAFGPTFVTAIDNKGAAWAWGQGSLGSGSISQSTTPIKVYGNKTFCNIASSLSFRLSVSALDKNGKAWAWGNNELGQLGNNSQTVASTPVAVYGNKTFCQIVINEFGTAALDKNGKAWAWGAPAILGNNSPNFSPVYLKTTPVEVHGSKTFCKISAAYDNMLAIDKYGKIWAWGYNSVGQIGDGTTNCAKTPVRTLGDRTFCKISGGGLFSFAIDKNGKIWGWGLNNEYNLGNLTLVSSRSPVAVCGCSKTFCEIQAYNQVFAIDNNKKIWTWGYMGDPDTYGKLGLVNVPGSPNRIVGNRKYNRVVARSFHSLALDLNGLVWGWGTQTNGVLGDNTTETRILPVSIEGQRKTFCKIASCDSFSAAIDKYGKVWTWGSNGTGQLGDGTTESKKTPIFVSALGDKTFCEIATGRAAGSGTGGYCLAIDKNGIAWGWGSNQYGNLGNNSNIGSLSPVQVYGNKTFCKITGNSYQVMALDKNGKIWGWGTNINFALGQNDTTSRITPVQIAQDKTFCDISMFNNSSLAVDKDGSIWGWGENYRNNVIPGFQTNYQSDRIRTPTKFISDIKFCKVTAGNTFSFAIDTSGRVFGWNYVPDFYLANYRYPSEKLIRPGYAPELIVPLGDKKYCEISCSARHTLAIDSEGNGWAWGRNDGYYAVGTIDLRTPVKICNF